MADTIDLADIKNMHALNNAFPKDVGEAIHRRLGETTVHVQGPFIGADDPLATDLNVTTGAILNLALRLFRRVTCSGVDPALLLPPGHAAKVGRTEDIPASSSVVIVVDPADDDLNGFPSVIHVGSLGWVAYLSRTPTPPRDPARRNPIAAYYAGAWAIQAAFLEIAEEHDPRVTSLGEKSRFNLWTATTDEDNSSPSVADMDLNLPETAVIGLGGVGQALIHALAGLDAITGQIHLVDPETIEPSNLQRYPLGFPETVNQLKVDVAAGQLQRFKPFLQVVKNGGVRLRFPELRAHLQTPVGTIQFETNVGIPDPGGKYAGFRSILHERALPLVISAVDTPKDRREIQMGLHRTILNGWTRTEDGSLTIGVGRHQIAGNNACLGCMYHPPPNQPTELEFITNLTRWPRSKVEEYLLDENLVLSPEDINAFARQWDVAPGRLAALVNQPLHKAVHLGCGLAALGSPGAVAPLPHMPSMTGALVAAAMLREVCGHASDAPAQIELNMLHVDPGSVNANRAKRDQCFCRDPIVRSAYAREWDMTLERSSPPRAKGDVEHATTDS